MSSNSILVGLGWESFDCEPAVGVRGCAIADVLSTSCVTVETDSTAD